jgi:20S proteasome subunit alpha 4
MLQDDRTVRKICCLDDHIAMAFAGLTADARVLIQRARVECQSYKLSVEDPVTVEYITRYIANLQQVILLHICIYKIGIEFFFIFIKKKYTQGRGRRPFGLSTLMVGFDYDGTSHLYQTDPSGTYHEWKANAIGRNAKSVREFLEKNYTEEISNSDASCIKLCIRALLEVVQSGAKNVEIAVARRNRPLEVINLEKNINFFFKINKFIQN